MSQQVAKIFQMLVDTDQVEKVAKLNESHMRDLYTSLSYDEQSLLWLNLQSISNRDYNVLAQKPETMIDVIREAQHQGFDGWTDEQQLVIRAFLADIAYAASQW